MSAFSTATVGTTTYTFTPDAGQCAASTTMDVVITNHITPTFDPVGPICQNASSPTALPTSSTNTTPITGSWSPAFSTATVGTYYTFTPDAGQCAASTTMDVVITNLRSPRHLTQLVRFASANASSPLRCQPVQLILLRLQVPGPRHSLRLLSVLLFIHLRLQLVSVLLPLL